jgi:hypothetical protein
MLTEAAGTRRFRALFLSDIHLGTRGCQAERLVELLRHQDAEVIYLVGDIVDGWQLRSGGIGRRHITTCCRRCALFLVDRCRRTWRRFQAGGRCDRGAPQWSRRGAQGCKAHARPARAPESGRADRCLRTGMARSEAVDPALVRGVERCTAESAAIDREMKTLLAEGRAETDDGRASGAEKSPTG